MKKSLLFLTLVIGFSGFATLFPGGDFGGASGSIGDVGWKRSWQCRNMKWENSGPKTKKRLAKNKCTQKEIMAGHDLMVLMIMEGVLIPAGIGAFAVVGGLVSMKEARKERVERLEQEARKAVEGKEKSPMYEAPKK